MLRDITVSFAPHISKRLSTQRVMLDVLIGLVPLVAAAGFYFRIRALLLIGVCVLWCVGIEWVCNLIRRRPNSLWDLSAVVTGVILVLTGGLLPAAIFVLKDFMDATPRSYEESARVFGASPTQVLRHVVLPIARPGLATIAVWALVNAWGDFLTAYILLRDPTKTPAGVVMYTFYSEGGQANLPLISAFSVLYALPVVVLYIFVSRRYGFRFHGGIKS